MFGDVRIRWLRLRQKAARLRKQAAATKSKALNGGRYGANCNGHDDWMVLEPSIAGYGTRLGSSLYSV
jgi:hypothetical protein